MNIDQKFRIATVLVVATTSASCLAADTTTPRDTAGETIQYRPPLRGAPAKRVGGATRAIFETKSPVTILAPNHVGFTIRDQPTLYWHSAQAPAGRVVFRLIAQDSATTVDERTLPESSCVGFYRFNLAGNGVTLKPETNYRWQVAIAAADQDTREVIAGGAIRYTTTDAPPADISTRPASERRRAFAEAGIWYDMVDEFMIQMKSAQADPRLATTFGDVLGQVGISNKLAASAICF